MSPRNRPNPERTAAPASGTPKRRSLAPVIGLVLIVLVAVGIALLVASGDEGEDTTSPALATAGVTVRGTPLPPLSDGSADPAAGAEAPTLEGVAPDGTPTTVDYGQPTLLAFLAHWCPHCQAELPRLVEMAEEGAFGDVEPVVVLTGTEESAPNYPPAAWLEREGWDGRVLVDDDGQSAASSFGLTSYPYLVLVDTDGNVIARHAGEMGREGLQDFVDQAG